MEPTAPITTRIRGIARLWDGARVHRDVSLLIRGGRCLEIAGPDDTDGGGDDGGEYEDIDADGLIAMPGLIDCHTHSTFAGSRVADFVNRLGGTSYTSLLEGGGGIHTTVQSTRMSTTDELTLLTSSRLEQMLTHGVTTVEVKSGYGLDLKTERRMIEAARASSGPVEVLTTFLAHVLPRGRDRVEYMRELLDVNLPALAPLVSAADVYCDDGAFTLAETDAILSRAKALGLGLHVHAEQVAYTGAAALAAHYGALSADHLERIDAAGINAMAKAGTVAVLLPGAMLYLKDIAPPVAALRAAGVPLAVATDFNPGSSPITNLWSAATLACLTMGLSVEEALAGITRNAARALGRPDLGWLGRGSAADFALFAPPIGEPPSVEVLLQYLGGTQAEQVWKAGQRVL
ncbi:MAG: imidazolonepropionase [Myxococcales bacterium]|nr:imidazolonepropionase [Myxococcales bacterium]